MKKHHLPKFDLFNSWVPITFQRVFILSFNLSASKWPAITRANFNFKTSCSSIVCHCHFGVWTPNASSLLSKVWMWNLLKTASEAQNNACHDCSGFFHFYKTEVFSMTQMWPAIQKRGKVHRNPWDDSEHDRSSCHSRLMWKQTVGNWQRTWEWNSSLHFPG